MYDPKFEKGVRQKMEGLQFSPSESVWANIEKAVASRRRRRSPFFFWRFAIPGMFLAGAIGALYLTARPVANPSPANLSPAASPTMASSVSVSSATTPKSATTLKSAATAKSGTMPKSAGAPKTTAPKSTAPVAKVVAPALLSSVTTANPVVPAATAARTSSHPGVSYTHRAESYTHSGESYTDAGESYTTASHPAVSHPSASHPSELGTVPSTLTTPMPYLYQPGLAGQGGASSIRAASLSAKKTIISLNTLQKPKRPWEAGFVGGIGISRLNRLNVSLPDVSSSAASFVNINNAAAAARASSSVSTSYAALDKRYVSDVRPDVSYMAGIYLQKPLSSRWILNLGMSLHYYSTRISIGQPVNTYVPASVSLITPTVLPAAQATPAYTAGDNQVYTNHYYFLELPVGMQYKLNKSRMLPLFLEGGFSLSRLMGADALLYNASTGIYYKDASVLQKTQLTISSSLMVGLPFHGIHIEMGPQVQYGLTPLINNPSLGDQHFLYTGIRVVVLPGRK